MNNIGLNNIGLDNIDRYCGCILGGAIGDALGSRIEGMLPEHIKEYYGEIIDFDGNSKYTDDTQQAIIIAENLICGNGLINPEKLAQQFLSLYQSGESRTTGDTFREACERLQRGVSWQNSGNVDTNETNNLPLGCGSAMRSHLLGLVGSRNRLYVNSILSSLPTHNHSETLAGAAIVAYAVHLVKDAVVIDNEFLIHNLIEIAEETEATEMSERLGQINIGQPESKFDIWGKVTDVVPSAISCFLKHKYNYHSAVLEAVNIGGDTDSRASITGAISGAYLGAKAIPEKWRDQIEDREKLETIAKKLYQLNLILRNDK